MTLSKLYISWQKDNYYCALKSLYLKFLCQINSLNKEVLEKSSHLPLPMITWEGKPKDQKLPSGHLLKDIIRSSELDLILPSQTLYPLHIKLWPLLRSSFLSPFIYLNRGRASSIGIKGKPKGPLSPCQGLTFCLPVIYHTLPLRPDQRGRLTVTSTHALLASPASPIPPRPIREASWGRTGKHKN